jgi:hypothetical protein
LQKHFGSFQWPHSEVKSISVVDNFSADQRNITEIASSYRFPESMTTKNAAPTHGTEVVTQETIIKGKIDNDLTEAQGQLHVFT